MTCKDCIHGELCMDRTELTSFTKTEYRVLDNVEKFCDDFKNKADFVEVVRCFWCKYAYNSMTRCYCNRFKADVCENSFCSYGEMRDT